MRTRWLSLLFALVLTGLLATAAGAQGPVLINVTQVDQSRFPQVDVYVSVTDASGGPVRNLAPNAFRLQQNGKPVNLLAATRSGEQGAVSTVLVIDRSGSMSFGGKMDGAKEAAATFVNQMRPGDKTALVQFDTEIDTLQPLTADKTALLASIQKITPRGNTALYDALAQAAKYFESESGRKAVIAVTDGMDNASKSNRDNALDLAQSGGYSIYTVGLGNRAAGYGNQEGIDEPLLREVAAASMGTYYPSPDASQLVSLYQQISLLIQNEYKLTYVSPDPLRDGLKRSIVVTAPGAATTGATYNPGGLIPEAATDWSSWVLFLVALALLAALFFAPSGLRLAMARSGSAAARPLPAAPRSRVKLTGAAPREISGGPGDAAAAAPRPTRIKLGRKTPGSSGPTGSSLPWEEH